MKKLEKKLFKKADKFVSENATKLDKELFDFMFLSKDTKDLYEELKRYQNEDGGFGHGLEPDFRTPLSSNMATTIAFQYFNKSHKTEFPDFMRKGIDYFVNNYNKITQRWLSIPEKSDESPHAVWWNYDLNKFNSDYQWGNPTVEIVGYLLQFENNFDKKELEELKHMALRRLFEAKEVEVHELLCYQRFVKALNVNEQKVVYEKISKLALNQVERDFSKWNTYVSRPLFFVDSIESPVYKVLTKEVNKELDYIIDTIGKDGSWYPNWHWRQYDDEWEKLKPEVAGMITVKNLITLKNFNRL